MGGGRKGPVAPTEKNDLLVTGKAAKQTINIFQALSMPIIFIVLIFYIIGVAQQQHDTASRLQSLSDTNVARKAGAAKQIQRRQRRAVAEPLGQRG